MAGSGPAASSSSVRGQTRSTNSGDHFQRIKDVVHPPPGHPFLKARPSKQLRSPFVTDPPPHSPTPPPSASTLLPPSFQNQIPPPFHIPPASQVKSGLACKSLVHQLLTMENGDNLCGLKCVLSHMETQAEDTAEVLELTLAFLNKCLALQKPRPKLRTRSLVVGKSKEPVVSCGEMSVLEQLVMVSKTRGTNTTEVETMVCQEATQVDFILCIFSGCVLTITILPGVELSPSERIAGDLLLCQGLAGGGRQLDTDGVGDGLPEGQLGFCQEHGGEVHGGGALRGEGGHDGGQP